MDKIEIKYDTSQYMRNEFLNFFINGESINEMIEHYYPGLSNGLIPPYLNLMCDSEEELVWEIFESNSKDVLSLPILICSDDLDLTCTVISVEVQKTKNSVKWLCFGHADEEGELYDDSILDKIPSFEFNKYAYEDVIRAFKWKRDTKLPQNIIFSVVLNSIFSCGDVTIYENYSASGKELLSFTNKEDFKDYLVGAIEERKSYLQFKLHYKEMGSEVNICKYSLDPTYCDGHTFRYKSEALGAIGFTLDASKGADEISCNLYDENPKQLSEAEREGWNWNAIDKIYTSLMADLTYVKERYKVENLMLKNVNKELE